jgi:hypothetical protein
MNNACPRYATLFLLQIARLVEVYPEANAVPARKVLAWYAAATQPRARVGRGEILRKDLIALAARQNSERSERKAPEGMSPAGPFASDHAPATRNHLVIWPREIDQFRRAADYVDRILRGETIFLVKAPTKLELLVNLETAKVLDLTIPSDVLATADEVIRMNIGDFCF